MLFVPGDRPERFAKAVASGADGVVIDLEDGVAAANKEGARANAAQWLQEGGTAIVRINALDTPWGAEDVVALQLHATGVMIPKAEARQIRDVMERLGADYCIPILETSAGILDARSIARVEGVVRLAFGNGDLATELGIHHADLTALAFARSSVVFASAAARIAPPLDGVTTAIHDDEVLAVETRHGVAMGFTGKLCVHPRQIPVVHRALHPTAEQLAWARAVVAGVSSDGATVVDGEMIDRPLLARARRIVRLAAAE